MEIIDSVRFRLKHFYRTAERSVREWLASVNETPIFILGNQKSGTTAIAVLLAERAGLSVEWDLSSHNFPLVLDIYQEKASLKRFVEENKLAFSKHVIKDCTLTFLYRHLKERFPRAQFVIVMRDPRDNIRSILDRLELSGDKTTLDPSQYEEMTNGWETVVNGRWMGIEGDTYIDHLAGRWKRAARICLDHQDRIELIRYEDFVQNKVEAIDDLVDRLGENKKNGIEEEVDQQFQPRGHRRNVDWPTFFGKSNLRRIETRCAEEMDALGYDSFHTV